MRKRLHVILLLAAALCCFSAARSFDPSSSAEEFLEWQENSRAFFSRVLFKGAPPAAVDPGPVFSEKETRESYELVSVGFTDRAGHTTTGRLARPIRSEGKKLPAVIALHGHGGNAYDTFDPDDRYFYADLFAKKGYIVLSLDIGHETLDARHPWLIRYQAFTPGSDLTYMGQRVWMVVRAIDLLETIPEVDAESIGVVGLSNGCLTALFASALDERIKLCVASGCLIMHSRMWHRELSHCRCQYLYKMDGKLDYYDLCALIAPRPLVIQSGMEDPIFPIGSADKAFARVKEAYEVWGAGDKVVHDVHNGAHEFDPKVPTEWFDRFLPLPD